MPEATARPAAANSSAGAFSPLGQPLFRNLWLATLVSNFGTYIQTVATSWSMVRLGAGADMIALVQTAANLPLMLFAILAGALADMFDRRVVMIAAQSLMLVASLMLALLAIGPGLPAWALLGFTFLIGCGSAFYNPAWSASIGQQVPRLLLPRAVALTIVSNNVARSAGPALGGLIVATAGSAVAFLANACSYLALIVVLIRWRRSGAAQPRTPHSFAGMIGEGFRYAARERPVASLLIRGTLFMVASSAVWALMPVIARDRLAGGAPAYGLLFGAFGAGAVIGAFISTPLRVQLGAEGLLAAGTGSFALASFAVALGHGPLLLMGAHLIAGASWVLVLSTFSIALQLGTPPHLVGRLIALYQSINAGGLAIGSLIWGEVAAHASTRAALLGAAALMLGALLLGLRRPVPVAPDALIQTDQRRPAR